MSRWTVVTVDDLGLTVEWQNEDLAEMPDWIARAAQQEFDMWPGIEPALYMLVQPGLYNEVQELDDQPMGRVWS